MWQLFTLLVGIVLLVYLLTVQRKGDIERQVYVSMTTIPERLNTDFFRHVVVENLLKQKPYRIILNIPYIYERTGEEYQIPEWLEHHETIVVNRCQDVGPATKIVESLDLVPDDALVVIVDDDFFYKDWLIERFQKQWIQEDELYCYYTFHERSWKVHGFDSRLPGGFSGCAARGKSLKKLQNVPILDQCFKIDDHWLGWMYHYLGIQVKQMPGITFWDESIHSKINHPDWYELQHNTNRRRQQRLCLQEMKNWSLLSEDVKEEEVKHFDKNSLVPLLRS